MTDAAAAPTAPIIDDDANWQRLHPATLALAVVKLGPRSLNFLPAVAALGFTGNWVWIVPAILAFLLFSLVAAWLHWLRFRFLVGDDEIVIESGVLSRQHRTIPFDRIQDVSIEQGLVSRALGIAKVGFETGAGGKENDADLDAIALDAAQALRTTIRAHRSGEVAAVAASDTPDAPPVAEDRLLFAMTPRQLLLAGLFNFSLAALAVVGAGMQFFDNLLPFKFNVFNPMDWADIAEDYGLDQWLLAHRWVAGIGAALSLLFIGFRERDHHDDVRQLEFPPDPRAARAAPHPRADDAHRRCGAGAARAGGDPRHRLVPQAFRLARTAAAEPGERRREGARPSGRPLRAAGHDRSRCWPKSRSRVPMPTQRGSKATASSRWAGWSARWARRLAGWSRYRSGRRSAGSVRRSAC